MNTVPLNMSFGHLDTRIYTQMNVWLQRYLGYFVPGILKFYKPVSNGNFQIVKWSNANRWEEILGRQILLVLME